MGGYGSYSILGANMKHFNDKYFMDERTVYVTWKCMCKIREDAIRVCM